MNKHKLIYDNEFENNLHYARHLVQTLKDVDDGTLRDHAEELNDSLSCILSYIERENSMIEYNQADKQLRNMVTDIMNNGFSSEGQTVRPKWSDGASAHTIKKFGVVNRYDLSDGNLPLSTFRKTNWKAAIDEILWIFQKKSNNVNDLGSKIWNQWANEDGSIGKAYGFQLGVKHKYKIDGEEVWMDQVDKALYDLKHTPYSRRIITSIYNHHDLSEMNLYPCAHTVTFNVVDGRLNAIMEQRSQDILAANNWNVVQYSALLLMFAQASGLKPGELVHVIADAHIYDRHLSQVVELVGRMPMPSSTTTLNPEVKDFYDFTVDDFEVTDYQYGSQMKFEVAV